MKVVQVIGGAGYIAVIMKYFGTICRVVCSMVTLSVSAVQELELVPVAFGENTQPLVDSSVIVDFSTRSFGASRKAEDRAEVRGSIWSDAAFVRMEQIKREPQFAPFLDLSVSDLLRYTEVVPDDVNAWTVLGVRWYQTNRVGDALAALEKARQLDAAHERSAELFSAILIHAGDPERAEKDVRKLLDELPQNRILRFNAACGYALWDKPAEAVHHLRVLAQMGWRDLRFYLNDPDLTGLVNLPEFYALVEELDRIARDGAVEALRPSTAWLVQP